MGLSQGQSKSSNPKNNRELKENIRREIQNIENSTFKTVFQNKKKRLDLIILEISGHIECQ